MVTPAPRDRVVSDVNVCRSVQAQKRHIAQIAELLGDPQSDTVAPDEAA
jgi:hypothetical protein